MLKCFSIQRSKGGLSSTVSLFNICPECFVEISCGPDVYFLIFAVQNSGTGTAESIAACQKLKTNLQAAFSVLPQDMQQLLLSNPKRSVLLQVSQEKVPELGDIVSETSL
jgi:hypothetical protein